MSCATITIGTKKFLQVKTITRQKCAKFAFFGIGIFLCAKKIFARSPNKIKGLSSGEKFFLLKKLKSRDVGLGLLRNPLFDLFAFLWGEGVKCGVKGL